MKKMVEDRSRSSSLDALRRSFIRRMIFFFQAEDGIRDLNVTGVQTCALPIFTWTTTPWTLPANVALAINPEIEYVRVEVGDEAFIVAEAAAEQILDRAVIKNQSSIEDRKSVV